MAIENEKIIPFRELICEAHIGLRRQGPGSPETTLRALGFIPALDANSKVLDLGCGTGGQTMLLAQNTAGSIIGVDLFPEFIQIFNDNAKKLGLSGRVKGVVGSMFELSFPKEAFGLIWSEGAIDFSGFEKGLKYWNGFLKEDGCAAVTCPSWFTDERPAEIEKFWIDEVGGLGTIAENISAMQRAGYSMLAVFPLPDKCWTDNYFAPREAAEKALKEKYPGNKSVEEYIARDKYEAELYEKYSRYYGYVFYVGKKI